MKNLTFYIPAEQEWLFLKRGLDDSYSLQCLALPGIMSDFCGFSVSACCASFVAHVVCASSAAAAFDVDNAACAFAH